MPQATIHLMPAELRRRYAFLRDEQAADIADFYRRGYFNRQAVVACEITGEDAAEEMFDLTNNPSRQEEREERYGFHRSVSTGDVVEVDGAAWLCLSVGWKQL